ncbi:MAG: PTS sugar transporter subunit IIB [Longicatena sp.]|uniref:PTS sugar transporter subunit IIB n=1 Tax=Anaerorhabdus sp. TaxID=1872524 RepID=UPI002FCB03AA
MVKILLVCSAGMSTSLMVEKMKTSAASQGLEVEIWAVADAEAKTNIDKADIMMLGPQVRFLEKKMKEIAGTKPVTVIDMQAYGTMNGEKVLAQALKILNIQ